MKRALIFAMAAVIMLCCGGCSVSHLWADYREIDDLELIRVLGVDKGAEGVTVTAGTGEWIDGERSRIISERAADLPSAINSMRCNPVGREPCFTHTEYLLAGEDCAREGLGGLLDYVERMTALRLKTGLFIVKGDSAESAIKNCAGENSSASDMLKYISGNVELMGLGSVYSCGQVGASLADRGIALAQAVKIRENSGSEGEYILEPTGYAALSDGRLLCFFEGEEARGMSMLTGRVKTCGISAELPGGGEAVTELYSLNVRTLPRRTEGRLTGVDVELDARANLLQVSGDANVEDVAVRAAIEEQLARDVEDAVAGVISRTQTLGLDFGGIGDSLDRRCPAKFARVRDDWDRIFPELDIRVHARVRLDRTFEIVDPLSGDGDKGGLNGRKG